MHALLIFLIVLFAAACDAPPVRTRLIYQGGEPFCSFDGSIESGADASDGGTGAGGAGSGGANAGGAAPTKLELYQTLRPKIVWLMLENRTLDSHFGTYPRFAHDGVDLWPAGWCVHDPHVSPTQCTPPYEFAAAYDANKGGPHEADDFDAMIDHGTTGSMDGFCVNTYANTTKCCTPGACSGGDFQDVMGYQPYSRMLPYYNVLDVFATGTRVFEGIRSWSEPGHWEKSSVWAAKCGSAPAYGSADASTCVTARNGIAQQYVTATSVWPWTPIMHLLYLYGAGWKAYAGKGGNSIAPTFGLGCNTADKECPNVSLSGNQFTTGSNELKWYPFCRYSSTTEDGQTGNCVDMPAYYADAAAGTLPDVSWIAPGSNVSDHPNNQVTRARKFALGALNALLTGPDWASARGVVFVITWDDGGGFFDHAAPPDAGSDELKIGLRTPIVVASTWAKPAYIDRGAKTTTMIPKFIEDVYAESARLPGTRSDPRPLVSESPSGRREDSPWVGDFLDFLVDNPTAATPLTHGAFDQ